MVTISEGLNNRFLISQAAVPADAVYELNLNLPFPNVIVQYDVKSIPIDLGLKQLEMRPFSGGGQLEVESDLVKVDTLPGNQVCRIVKIFRKFHRLLLPPHAQHDYLLVKMPPFEEILCRGRFRHPGRYGSASVFLSLHQNQESHVLRRGVERVAISLPGFQNIFGQRALKWMCYAPNTIPDL